MEAGTATEGGMQAATTPAEGLRARKKRQTRAAIAAAAMELFQSRGFDAVTIADIAVAADVSRKTVFNYFPAKEDLVFEAGQERRAALVQAIRERPAGTSLVAPFRAATMDYLERLAHDPVDATLAIPRLVAGSTALRNRLFLGWEEEAAVLGPVLAQEAGDPPAGVVPTVVARTLAWTHRTVFRAAFMRLLAGEPRDVVAADLREQAARAYDLLEDGLGGYGTSPAGVDTAVVERRTPAP
jgi:AcrR family transcriptional regulator